MMSEPVLQGVPKLEIIVFQWARDHGDCQECGLPAAFFNVHTPVRILCAVCAANAAAEGEEIMRLEEIG